MPFQEQSLNDARRKLVWLICDGGLSVSEAARVSGVTRPTAYRWLERALQEGVDHLEDRSRRPHRVARCVPVTVEGAVLSLKSRHPSWGAKKIHTRLWPPLDGSVPKDDALPEGLRVCVRTVDRVLDRHGQVQRRSGGSSGNQRYERAASNELWQVDGKGIPRGCGYWPISVLDDHSRFLVGLHPLANKRIPTVLALLWDLFGEYGLPLAILTDNGDGFNDWQAKGPTRFEAQLWLLGIRTPHGRIRHPQTQGKVERFHGTLEGDLGERLRPATREEAERIYRAYRREYNWERPHEALGMKVPGAVYVPSLRKRPETMPAHELPEGTMTRKVGVNGEIVFHGQGYLVGKGLRGEYVEIREESCGYAAYYAGVRIADLQTLKL